MDYDMAINIGCGLSILQLTANVPLAFFCLRFIQERGRPGLAVPTEEADPRNIQRDVPEGIAVAEATPAVAEGAVVAVGGAVSLGGDEGAVVATRVGEPVESGEAGKEDGAKATGWVL